MKKVLNDPQNCVSEMLEGFASYLPNVKLILEHKILIRADIDEVKQRQVVLISGGGSGHEPAHGGYIGDGALGAVVCGEVFSSPSQEAVLAAIRACSGPHGVLLIIKNYTGDKINFKLAAEVARTEYNIKVDTVVIADDVALLGDEHSSDTRTTSIGARGIAGVVMLHKYAGSLAKSGFSLEELAKRARLFANDIKTMGVALTPCVLPSLGRSTFTIDPSEMEIGLGIHGEHGVAKEKLKPCDEIVELLLQKVLKFTSAPRDDHGRYAVLVNNLGSLTLMEQAIVTRAVLNYFGTHYSSYSVSRCYVGQFLTAMEMSGFSLSVVPLDDDRLKNLDSPTTAPAWVPSRSEPRLPGSEATRAAAPVRAANAEALKYGPKDTETTHGRVVDLGFKSICDAMKRNEQLLTSLDAAVGDGDLGSNLEIAANKLTAEFGDSIPKYEPADFFSTLSTHLQNYLGGTSGPMYSIFCRRFGEALRQNTNSWVAAFDAGIKGIEYLGDSSEGDRTMIDALRPALRAMQALPQDATAGALAKAAVQAAREGVEKTKHMIAKRGRSSYLRERVLGHVDPGAKAVEVALEALANSL